jgi:hypothetical protein
MSAKQDTHLLPAIGDSDHEGDGEGLWRPDNDDWNLTSLWEANSDKHEQRQSGRSGLHRTG